jgi:predicted dehydrogenase
VVAASLGRVCPAIVGEDRATIAMMTDDGILVTMDGDGAAHGYPPRSMEELEINGTRGTLRFADMTLSLSGAETASIPYERDAIYQASFDACIRHFVECLASGAEFETAPADNLETLRLVEDTYTLAGEVRDLTASS